jgi:hypothetical protein
MRQQTRSLATRLRTAWSARTPQPEHTAPASLGPAEDFAARLRAAVEAARH